MSIIISNAVFLPTLSNFDLTAFFKMIFGWEVKDAWKIDSILLDCKFLEFSCDKIRFVNGAHLLNLEPFGLSFLNGGSTCLETNAELFGDILGLKRSKG